MISGYIKREGLYDIPYVSRIKADDRKVVIAVHGFASSKASPTINMLMDKFPDVGLGIIAFDFPAHGESVVDGDFLSVDNCVRDLRDIERYTRKICPKAEICYFGSSFGAYITLIYIMNDELRHVRAFLRSAAVNMSEYFLELTDQEKSELEKNGYFVINDSFRNLKVTRELIEDLRRHNLMEYFEAEAVSLKMIHGSNDEDIAYARAAAFAEKYGIELVTVDGGDHRLSVPGAPQKVLNEAIEFLKGDIK